MKILYISEMLRAPFDEGFKNVIFSLHFQLNKKTDTLTVTKKANNTEDLNIEKISLNKLFLNNGLRKLIKRFSPETILYVPSASCSFYSFFRAKMLKLMSANARVAMIGMQHRKYPFLQSVIMTKLLKPDLLMLMVKSDGAFFEKKGLNIKILPPAVDTVKFCPPTAEEKQKIRYEYKIPYDKKVFLHVGHIKANRNIECLLKLQESEDAQVIIVGSTSIVIENDLKKRLVREGVMVIDKYMPDISEIYKMSDVYVFPVIHDDEAINMPLSVLEAMACNLPVITTRFGGLADNFQEDDAFKYFDTTEELISLIERTNSKAADNRKKIMHLTWSRFADRIIDACREIL